MSFLDQIQFAVQSRNYRARASVPTGHQSRWRRAEAKVDCYYDANFAGFVQDSISSRSKMGYLFMLGWCTILWDSKLQSHQEPHWTVKRDCAHCDHASAYGSDDEGNCCRIFLPLADILMSWDTDRDDVDLRGQRRAEKAGTSADRQARCAVGPKCSVVMVSNTDVAERLQHRRYQVTRCLVANIPQTRERVKVVRTSTQK